MFRMQILTWIFKHPLLYRNVQCHWTNILVYIGSFAHSHNNIFLKNLVNFSCFFYLSSKQIHDIMEMMTKVNLFISFTNLKMHENFKVCNASISNWNNLMSIVKCNTNWFFQFIPCHNYQQGVHSSVNMCSLLCRSCCKMY
jgi:hypothetical protein